MNDEILENLLIDRALGQLSPDVSALLDDYLARNPDALRLASELNDTVLLASNALRSTAATPKPPERCEAIPAPIPFRAALAMAASFVVGAGMTWFALQQAGPSSSSPVGHRTAHERTEPVPVAPRAGVTYAKSGSSIRSLPFWSRERAYLLSQHSEAMRR